MTVATQPLEQQGARESFARQAFTLLGGFLIGAMFALSAIGQTQTTF